MEQGYGAGAGGGGGDVAGEWRRRGSIGPFLFTGLDVYVDENSFSGCVQN